jgi:hypothetical protein
MNILIAMMMDTMTTTGMNLRMDGIPTRTSIIF